MKQPDLEAAKQYALVRLERELPAHLTYHSIRHTRDEVVPAVELLVDREGLDDEARLLARTAAWFHDLGFVEQLVDHEAAGVRIAGQVLPSLAYTPAQIAAIAGMIMATKLPQSPQSLLECVLADADLDGLGRDDFWSRNADLRAELASRGAVMSDRQWYSDQLVFLMSHRYWTPSAGALRDPQKQLNIEALARQLQR